jgi:hypothetical protein
MCQAYPIATSSHNRLKSRRIFCTSDITESITYWITIVVCLPRASALELVTEMTTLRSTVPLVNSTHTVWKPADSKTVYCSISNDTVTAEESQNSIVHLQRICGTLVQFGCYQHALHVKASIHIRLRQNTLAILTFDNEVKVESNDALLYTVDVRVLWSNSNLIQTKRKIRIVQWNHKRTGTYMYMTRNSIN